MLTLEDFRAARARIQPHIRKTPMIQAHQLQHPPAEVGDLWLKLECLQVTGAFKARGALSKLLSLSPDEIHSGVVTASGGNHGLAVAYAGWVAHVPTLIYLPTNTPVAKAEKLERWGATVVWEGEVWDDANRAALAIATERNMAYIHPFADPVVIAGQGTIGLEILEEAPQTDVLLAAIGGGGLIGGVSAAIKLLKPQSRVIGVEPEGAPTLKESLKADRIVTLPYVRTAATTLAPRQSTDLNLKLVRHHVDEIVLVSDAEMQHAAEWLWFEMGIAAELSGAATVAALLFNKVQLHPQEQVCALVCGSGTDGLSQKGASQEKAAD